MVHLVGRVARTELRVALRDGRVRWTLGVLLALLVVTGTEGWRRSVEVRTERVWAQRLVREQWLGQRPKDPHAAAYFGTYVFQPISELAFLDPGVLDHVDLVDADRNGTLSPAEVLRLEDHVRQEQGRSGFFTTITLDGNAVLTPAPQGFGARVDQGRLVYQFTLPIQDKGAPRGTVDVVVDDPNDFIAFMLAPGTPVQASASAPFGAECRVVREKAAYTFDVIKCTCTRRGR